MPDDRAWRGSANSRRAVAAAIFSGFWLLASCFFISDANTQEVTNKEPLVIETEIELDQIVVTRDERPDTVIVSASPETAEVKEPAEQTAELPTDSPGAGGPMIDGRQLLRLNGSLKRILEENIRLQEQNNGMEQQLKNIRGQINIETNRSRNMKEELDAFNAALQQAESERKRLQEEMAAVQQALADKQKEVNILVKGGAEPAMSGLGDSTLVQVPAQEIRDMRLMILTLQKEIVAKEDQLSRTTTEQKAAQEAEIAALQAELDDRVRALEQKDQDFMTAMSEAKTAAQEERERLAGDLETLQATLAAKENGFQFLVDKEKATAAVEIDNLIRQIKEKEKAFADNIAEEKRLAAEKIAGLEEQIRKQEEEYALQLAQAEQDKGRMAGQITDLEARLSSKEEEFNKFKLDQNEAEQAQIADFMQKVNDLEAALSQKEQELTLVLGQKETEGQEERARLQAEIAALQSSLASQEQSFTGLQEKLRKEEGRKVEGLLADLSRIEEQAPDEPNLAAAAEAGMVERVRDLRARLQDFRSRLVSGTTMVLGTNVSKTSSVIARSEATKQSYRESGLPRPFGGHSPLAVGTSSSGSVVRNDERLDLRSLPELTGTAFQDETKAKAVIDMIENLSQENSVLKADEGKVHYNMGNIFFRQADYRRAREEFKKAVELMPHDANAHFNLAFVSGEFLKDFKAALEHYNQYLWLNPEARDAALVREKIIAAQMEIMGRLDSPLEAEWSKEQTKAWK